MTEETPHYGAKTMSEDFLDCSGRKRTFRLQIYAAGLFLEAVEVRNGEPTGWRFVLPVKADEPAPWGEMRDMIREHLSRRDVVRDENGELQLLHRTIRAQIEEGEDGGAPNVLVDDLELSWEELGKLLASFVGFRLRIEVRDVSEGSGLVRV